MRKNLIMCTVQSTLIRKNRQNARKRKERMLTKKYRKQLLSFFERQKQGELENQSLLKELIKLGKKQNLK